MRKMNWEAGRYLGVRRYGYSVDDSGTPQDKHVGHFKSDCLASGHLIRFGFLTLNYC